MRGRCGAPNLCEHCAKLGAIENAEVLTLDALAGASPAIWAVLTTSRPSRDTRRFYRSREAVVRALRRRWPSCEYAALVEFTTGYGTNSGGRRRPHWNLLLKGVEAAELEEAASIIRRVWCSREDATPAAQHVGLVGEAGGLMRYISLHFQKMSQAPPAGWRGHRFLKSRGYLAQPTPEARAAAREAIAVRREIWRAMRAGLTGDDVEARVQLARAIAADTSWQLVTVPPLSRAPACERGAVRGATTEAAPEPAPQLVDALPARTADCRPTNCAAADGGADSLLAARRLDSTSRRPPAAGAIARGRSPASGAGT